MKNENHKLLLQLLSETVRRFDEAGIFYTLACGSVLGAVRHGGFIPWDADIDLYVLLSDLDRIRAVFPADDETVRLISYKTDTTSTHDKVAHVGIDHSELHLDLYPLIGVPEEESKRQRFLKRCHLLNKIYACKYENAKTVRRASKRFCFRCLQLFERCIPDACIRRRIERIETRYDAETSTYLSCFANDGRLGDALPREVLLTTKTASFEGLSVKIPADHDRYLRSLYGEDYMTPKQY